MESLNRKQKIIAGVGIVGLLCIVAIMIPLLGLKPGTVNKITQSQNKEVSLNKGTLSFKIVSVEKRPISTFVKTPEDDTNTDSSTSPTPDDSEISKYKNAIVLQVNVDAKNTGKENFDLADYRDSFITLRYNGSGTNGVKPVTDTDNLLNNLPTDFFNDDLVPGGVVKRCDLLFIVPQDASNITTEFSYGETKAGNSMTSSGEKITLSDDVFVTFN